MQTEVEAGGLMEDERRAVERLLQARGADHPVDVRRVEIDVCPLETASGERRCVVVIITRDRVGRASSREQRRPTGRAPGEAGEEHATAVRRREHAREAAATYTIYVRCGGQRLIMKRRIRSLDAARVALQALRAGRFHDPDRVFLVEDRTGRVIDGESRQ